jgi:hypothetical protein
VKKNRLYIYLARLDRKGIEVVAGFPYGKKVYPTRVRDVASLGMSPTAAHKVSAALAEKRMTHELYAESAGSFEELKKSLRERGYSSLPMQQFTGYTKPTTVDDRSLVTKSSTMVQRARK